MKLVVVGPPFPFAKETKIINELFELGMDYHHVRSPFIELDVQRKFIRQISKAHRNKVIIHQHYDTAEEFDIRGVHFPEKVRRQLEAGNEDLEKWLQVKKDNPNFHLSTSYHDLDVMMHCALPFNYVMMGPIYESISKDNYTPSFSMGALQRAIGKTKVPVVGVGGMRANNIKRVAEMGASGVATLGYIWKSENPIEAFKELKKACDQISTS